MKAKPAVLNSRTATAQAQSFLANRFETAWTNAPRRWLKCPSQEIIDETDEDWAFAICQFEFRQGARYRGGSFLVKLEDDVLRVRSYHDDTYTKIRRACSSLSSTKRGFVNGVRLRGRRLRASALIGCHPLMIGDIDYDISQRFPRPLRKRYRTAFHGTNRAGFEDQVSFACRVKTHALGGSRKYSLACKNRLGDSFRYSVIAQKRRPRSVPKRVPAAKPPRRSTGCDPNYSGCLDPNVSDYDCAGGSGDGPKYTGLVRVKDDDHYDLDRDGDGIACDT